MINFFLDMNQFFAINSFCVSSYHALCSNTLLGSDRKRLPNWGREDSFSSAIFKKIHTYLLRMLKQRIQLDPTPRTACSSVFSSPEPKILNLRMAFLYRKEATCTFAALTCVYAEAYGELIAANINRYQLGMRFENLSGRAFSTITKF